MINPLELRIGNYIEIPNAGYPTEVDGVTRFSISDIFGSIELDRLNPINLTEDCLLKLGFKDDRIDIGNDWYTVYSHGEDSFIFSQNNHKVRVVKYVHQLQNIVFALTGEELTIKY